MLLDPPLPLSKHFLGTVNLSNPRAIFAGSPPRFTRSRVTYEAYVVSGTSTRPQVDSAACAHQPLCPGRPAPTAACFVLTAGPRQARCGPRPDAGRLLTLAVLLSTERPLVWSAPTACWPQPLFVPAALQAARSFFAVLARLPDRRGSSIPQRRCAVAPPAARIRLAVVPIRRTALGQKAPNRSDRPRWPAPPWCPRVPGWCAAASPRAALASSASLSPSTAADPHRVVSFINAVGGATAARCGAKRRFWRASR